MTGCEFGDIIQSSEPTRTRVRLISARHATRRERIFY